MNVARLDLCKELFELSGWKDTEKYWYENWLKQDSWQTGYLGQADETTYPAYDLGYLLRKLPQETRIIKGHFTFGDGVRYHAHYQRHDPISDKRYYCTQSADVPEDAACALSIELFKQDVLKREQSL